MKDTVFKEFLLYALVGGICTLIDIATLFILTSIGGVHYLISSSVSFSVGVVLNWILCSHFVFSFHKVHRQRDEFMCYVLISLVGLGLNFLLMWFFTEICGTWFMLSKLLSAAITVFYNFLARKLLLHTQNETYSNHWCRNQRNDSCPTSFKPSE